jgi:hypothetical protein
MHCLPPITVSLEKRLRVSLIWRVADSRILSRGVDLIYNKLQNLISQKLKKLFERKFQRVFIYTYTASSGSLSSLALS